MSYIGNRPAFTVTSLGLSSQISGLSYANNVSDAVNDIDVAIGAASDSTNTDMLVLSALITKRLDAAWAVGTNQGGLDTGSIGNSDYYIHLIKRVDTGVVDVLFSLSHSAPTMPTSYTLRRLIGWFKRVGATIVAMHSYEGEGGAVELLWDVPTLDQDLSNVVDQTKRTHTVKTPQNFSTMALLNVMVYDASGTSVVWIFNPDHTGSVDPALATAPLGNFRSLTSYQNLGGLEVRTSSAGLVASRADITSVDNVRIMTRGFKWSRRSPL